MAFSPNLSNVLFENWLIASPLSTNTVSTCTGNNFLGGPNVFNWQTKLSNNFHISYPHYKAKMTFKVIRIFNIIMQYKCIFKIYNGNNC